MEQREFFRLVSRIKVLLLFALKQSIRFPESLEIIPAWSELFHRLWYRCSQPSSHKQFFGTNISAHHGSGVDLYANKERYGSSALDSRCLMDCNILSASPLLWGYNDEYELFGFLRHILGTVIAPEDLWGAVS